MGIASYTALLGPPHAIANEVRIWYGTGPNNGAAFSYLCYEITLRPDNTGGLDQLRAAQPRSKNATYRAECGDRRTQ